MAINANSLEHTLATMMIKQRPPRLKIICGDDPGQQSPRTPRRRVGWLRAMDIRKRSPSIAFAKVAPATPCNRLKTSSAKNRMTHDKMTAYEPLHASR